VPLLTIVQNQLFHPFSQENPLQTGTGLGLAIVNSIVRSTALDGTIDVSSAEGVGTEIRVAFVADVVEEDDLKSSSSVASTAMAAEAISFDDLPGPPKVALIGFDRSHRGVELLRSVTCKYLTSWGFDLEDDDNESAGILILNESIGPLLSAIRRKDTSRSFIVLCSSRGDSSFMGTVDEYERIGGFARLVFKPGGPSRLRAAIKLCVHAQKMIVRSRCSTLVNPIAPAFKLLSDEENPSLLPRRNSAETWTERPIRPSLGPRAITMHPPLPEPREPWPDDDAVPTAAPREEVYSPPRSPEQRIRAVSLNDEGGLTPSRDAPHSSNNHDPTSPITVPIAGGGTLLKSSLGAPSASGGARVLVVEDNSILRSLL
jgi:hypothetical protein